MGKISFQINNAVSHIGHNPSTVLGDLAMGTWFLGTEQMSLTPGSVPDTHSPETCSTKLEESLKTNQSPPSKKNFQSSNPGCSIY